MQKEIYKAIIVDDEERARNVLRILIEENCPEIEIADAVSNVADAVKSIHKHKVDLVFLDIEMPGYSGLQLVEFFEKINFKIIFTTAYSEYALQAIKASALDYLLKPLKAEDLVAAVEKFKSITNLEQEQSGLKHLAENMNSVGSIAKIALPTSYGLMFVEIKDVLYFEAEGSYTNVYLSDGQKILISRKLKEFEYLEQHPIFYKTHRSYLVNLTAVRKFVRNDGGYILMSNDQQVGLSRDKKEQFIEAIKSAGII